MRVVAALLYDELAEKSQWWFTAQSDTDEGIDKPSIAASSCQCSITHIFAEFFFSHDWAHVEEGLRVHEIFLTALPSPAGELF